LLRDSKTQEVLEERNFLTGEFEKVTFQQEDIEAWRKDVALTPGQGRTAYWQKRKMKVSDTIVIL
jgi:hypothetical protein